MIDLAYPRQVILVTTRHDVKDKFSDRINEKDNVMAVDWHMPVSFEPKMYAISIAKTRFSLELIRDSKVFCINFIPYHLEEAVKFIGKHSGEHIDKIEKTGLTLYNCNSIHCGYIKESTGFFECHVEKEIDAGDHIVFIGRVVHITEKDDTFRLFHKKTGDQFTTTK